jgi:hypothetical protein
MLIHSAEITGSVQLNNTDVSAITNVAGFATTSSVNTLVVRTGSYATTGSNQFNGNQSISGSITSNGTITAQTLVVQTVTSSIEFVTGSTRNGSLAANTHQFTGSVLVSSSLVIGATSSDTSYNAGSWFNNSGLAVGNITSTSGIQINSSPTSTLSSIRFGDGDGVNNLYDQGFINYNHNLDRLAFGANRGTAMTITSAGVKFAGGASSLNYYEEGTWTPSLRGQDVAGTVGYQFRSATYVRIGNYVFVRWGFKINSISGASGTMQISGLPFTSVEWGGYQEPNVGVSTGLLATADNAFKARVFVRGSSTLLEGRIANNSDTGWNISEFNGDEWVIGEIFYNIA